jgi:hypothetical protein
VIPATRDQRTRSRGGVDTIVGCVGREVEEIAEVVGAHAELPRDHPRLTARRC